MTDDANFKHGIFAQVIKDSISPDGMRLTTMEWTFHRFILAEVNTHRVLSRNSASSRAIPVEKQLRRVMARPARPVTWPAEQRGMQGGAELEEAALEGAHRLFDDIHAYTTERIREYIEDHPDKSTRLHKSLINRLLEPFMWHTAIITATDWDGLWHQRCHKDAQPEFQVVARTAKAAYERSSPNKLGYGDWHLPYISGRDVDAVPDVDDEPEFAELSHWEVLKRVSVARCARVSYLTHDGRRSLHDDLRLYSRLTENLTNGEGDPWHASPLEHVATPVDPRKEDPVLVPGNFTGWKQLRHIVEEAAEEAVT